MSSRINSNDEAFETLFVKNRGKFTFFAKNYCRDEFVAEDIVVESFLYYWNNKERLADHTNIEAYILTTIKNKCLNFLKQQQIHNEAIEQIQKVETWELNFRIASLEACEPQKLYSEEIQGLVNKALESLPLQTRDIYVRSRNLNQSHKEISDDLKLSTKSIEYHISQALKIIRVALKDYLFIIIATLVKCIF